MDPSLKVEHKNRGVGSFSNIFSPPYLPSSISDDHPTRKKTWRFLFFVNNGPSCSANINIPSNPAGLRNGAATIGGG